MADTGNGIAWQTGHCGFCGIRFEHFDDNHISKCQAEHQRFKNQQEKDPVYQLKRVADSLQRLALSPKKGGE